MDEHDERCSHRDGTQHAATVRPPSSPRGTRFAKASPSPHTHTVCVFVLLQALHRDLAGVLWLSQQSQQLPQ